MADAPLNADQLHAASLLDRNVVLSAGAGCGKTSTLVKRFTNIIEANLACVNEIAAVTFTEKAADELKSRVRARLRCLMDNAASPAQRRAWRKTLLAVETARIGTIHSFCSDILREYSVAAKVDPAFSVIEQIQSDELASSAIRDSLFQAVQSRDPAAIALLSRFDYPPLESMLADSLRRRDDIARLAARLGLASDNAEQIGRALSSLAASTAVRAAVDMLTSHTVLRSVSLLAQFQGPDGDLIEKRRRAFLDDYGALKTASEKDIPRIVAAMNESLNLRGGSAKGWGEDFQPAKDLMKRLREKEVKPVLEILQFLEEEDWTARAAEVLNFSSLHTRVLAAYSSVKRASGFLDFDDLLAAARNLVVANPSIARDVASECKFILVDEFQDTDQVQFDLITALADAGSNLFVVGDAEQSIYAFRGAKVEIFNHLRTAYASSARGEVARLSANYRTVEHVIEFVNILFSRLMPPGSPSGWMIPHQPLVSTRQAPRRNVEFILANDTDSISAVRRIEAQAVALRISQIVDSGEPIVAERDAAGETSFRPAGFGDFAVLLRSMSSVAIYERELEARSIPFYTVAGSTFYMRQEVKDVINYLRFLVDGTDSLGLVGALRSPLFAVSDDCLAVLSAAAPLSDYFSGLPLPAVDGADFAAIARAVDCTARLALMANRASLREMLDTLYEGTGYLAALSMLYNGRQRVANALKLRDAASSFDARGASLEDFVVLLAKFETQEIRESAAVIEDEKSPVVRIMTIHAAKGLEFPIVIVADAGRKPNFAGGRSGPAPVYIDPQVGISLPSPSGQDDSPYRRMAKYTLRNREHAEDLRIFFVAATRARDHLIISGAASAKDSADLALHGWAGAVVSALDVDLDRPGTRDFGGFSLETSLPQNRTFDGSGWNATHLHAWRDLLLTGTPLPEPARPLQLDNPRLSEQLPAFQDLSRRFTATALADFARCPLRYELMHMRRIPPDFILDDCERTSRPPGHIVGTLLHNVLERVRSSESLSAALERLLAADGSLSPLMPALRAVCVPILQAFEKSAFYREIVDSPGVRREREFSFRLAGRLLEGKIDLVSKGRIIDFKSDDVSAAEATAYAEHYRTQMDVYALAYAGMFATAPLSVTLYFLRPEVDVTWEYGDRELAAAEGRVLEMITAIDAGPPFIARRSDSCRCEYKTLCAAIARRRTNVV